MQRKMLSGLLAVVFAGLLTAGCGKGEIEGVARSEEAGEPEEIQTETQQPVKDTSHEGKAKSYLTGQWISEKLATNRPVAIMTENTEITQPSYGTSRGDIYYECPMEGGLTRMMVLYQNYKGMERIGNIRSARNYFVYYAREFDALFFHAGQSHFAKELVYSDFIDNVNGIMGKADPFYYRTPDRRAPHNFYTSSDQIRSAVRDYGYRAKLDKSYKGHYRFAEDEKPVELKDGIVAKKVEVYYPVNHPWFEYNAKKGIYYRFQYGGKQTDGMNGRQLSVSNIIIQDCDVYVWEEKTGYMYVDCTSGGTGKYITRGKCIDITWKKTSDEAPTRYYDKNGKEITLNQGKTWIEIVDRDHSDRHVISDGRETKENGKQE